MAPWFPRLDDALGGIADAVKGLGSTAGQTAGGAAGGLFGGAGDLIFKIVLAAIAAWVLVEVVL